MGVAFFFILNYLSALNKFAYLNFSILISFLFFSFLFIKFFLREDFLRLIINIIAPLFFIYGILQRFIIFPYLIKKIGIAQSIQEQSLLWRLKTGRIFTFFQLPTLYAYITAVLLIMLIHYFFEKKDKGRIYYLSCIIIGVLNLFLTQSYGGMAAFFIGLVFYLYVNVKSNKNFIIIAFMSFALVVFIVSVLRFEEIKDFSPVRLRWGHWKQTARAVADYPVLGMGLGNYSKTVGRYVHKGEPKSIYTHNAFWQLQSEIGVIGLLLLLSLFIAFFKDKLVPVKQRPQFYALLLLSLIYNFIDIGFYLIIPGFILSLIFAYIREDTNNFKFDEKKKYITLFFFFLSLSVMVFIYLSDRKNIEGELLRGGEQAENAFKSSIRLNPFNDKAWLNLAIFELQRGNYIDSEKYVDLALKYNNTSAKAYYLKSLIFARKGYLLHALSCAKKAKGNFKINDLYNKNYEQFKRILSENN